MSNLITYLPILLVVLLGIAIAGGSMFFSQFIGKKKPGKVKSEAYECGIPAVGDGRLKFSAKFYPIALLFLLFDIEMIFILVWAFVFKTPGLEIFLFVEMVVFAAILLVAFLYAWRKGVFDLSKEN